VYQGNIQLVGWFQTSDFIFKKRMYFHISDKGSKTVIIACNVIMRSIGKLTVKLSHMALT